MNTRTVLVSVTALFVFAVPVHARPVQWTLQDVTLVDTTALNFPGFGGYPETSYGRRYNASGSFVYDATTHSVQDWNITAAGLPLASDEGLCLNLPGCTHASWSAAEFTLEFAGTFTGDSFTFSHSEGSPASNFSLELDV